VAYSEVLHFSTITKPATCVYIASHYLLYLIITNNLLNIITVMEVIHDFPGYEIFVTQIFHICQRNNKFIK